MNIRPPWERDYKDRTEDVTIYSYFETWMEDQGCRNCGEEDCQGECEDNEPRIPLKEMDLQKIIDLLPSGVKPSDVKMKMSTDSGDYPAGHYITFYYSKFFPADSKAYKKDKAKYDAAYAEYKEKQSIYDTYIRQREIKELEEKLAKLKK